MTPDEYPAWEEIAVRSYAESQVRAGNWAPEVAIELSAKELLGLLTEGVSTPGHNLWVARDVETAARVGTLWMIVRSQGGYTEAYVYDLWVESDQRGAGYGRAIMEAGAAVAKERGADAMALNVHGYNHRAYSLYRSLGYQVANSHMRLPL
ncbi:MAG: GNAT family N-acetyltransferase [Catenulispora sp.]|nr:GNAT family N-acetyltransferase [Catenulispora sp.]